MSVVKGELRNSINIDPNEADGHDMNIASTRDEPLTCDEMDLDSTDLLN
jgi:hypothetical protein